MLSDLLAALLPEADTPADDAAVTVAQLGRLPLILHESWGSTRSITDAWFLPSGLSPRLMVELGSVEAIKVLVESGLGAAVLPTSVLHEPMPGAVTRGLRPAPSRDLGYILCREKVVDRGLRLLITAPPDRVGVTCSPSSHSEPTPLSQPKHSRATLRRHSHRTSWLLPDAPGGLTASEK